QGDSVFEIGRDSTLTLNAAVSERSIAKVAVGQEVEISVNALEKEFSGSVLSVSSLASKISNGSVEETVVQVEIALDGDTAGLKSGYSAKGKIKTGYETSIITLPYSAICQDEQGEYIYILKNGRAKRKNITTGRELAGCTEVSGVTTEDAVINNPTGIAEGMLVVTE
ncbi:MAG: HlyD family efflux transporter periplasmic adaptor subunit, partial [Ruminiclostridium sp.]|nr:HlyD family efflux transporter periplasmic adaptor subunit [Ruminiclostridium sp.]